MMNLRVRFIRGEEVKYISHLDLMKVFERALRRAALPIAYSQGFNPHPHMVFGLPLSVGVTSEAEYGDFELTLEMEPSEFIKRLNSELPKGLLALDAGIRKGKGNIMATISAASYNLLAYAEGPAEPLELQKSIDALMEQTEIMIKKEGKKGLKDVNIRPMVMKVQAMRLEDEGDFDTHQGFITPHFQEYYKKYSDCLKEKKNIICLHMLLSAGSSANLKPELLFSKIGEVANTRLTLIKIHRTGLLIGQGEQLKSPLSLDTLLAI